MAGRHPGARGDTRAALFDAALALVNERGYENVSVADIVAKAGVSRATFYHYFESKDQLFYDNRMSEAIMLDHDAITLWGDLPLADWLKRYVAEWFRLIRANDPESNMQWLGRLPDGIYRHSAPEGHAADSPATDMTTLHMRTVRSRLAQEAGRGLLKEDAPIDQLARLVIVCMYGTLVHHCAAFGTFDLAEWLDWTVSVLLADVLAPYRAG